MDLLWCLHRRLNFIDRLYDQTTAPFQETIRKIESGEPPFDYSGDPEYIGGDPPWARDHIAQSRLIEIRENKAFGKTIGIPDLDDCVS